MFPNHLRHSSDPDPDPPQRGPGILGMFLRSAGYLAIFGAILLGGFALGPGLPAAINPMSPLDPQARPGLLTRFKLDRAVATPQACLAVLGALRDARFARLADREVGDGCHIRGHTLLRGLSRATLSPVSTSCATALRLYMWERHEVQPAAQRVLGARAREISHLSSFSCRPIRTEAGDGASLSAHATASAIDISGIVLENGRRLDLSAGWDGRDTRVPRFWREVRDGACRWFPTVLSPDFNGLHAGHFHLAAGRTTACR